MAMVNNPIFVVGPANGIYPTNSATVALLFNQGVIFLYRNLVFPPQPLNALSLLSSCRVFGPVTSCPSDSQFWFGFSFGCVAGALLRSVVSVPPAMVCVQTCATFFCGLN